MLSRFIACISASLIYLNVTNAYVAAYGIGTKNNYITPYHNCESMQKHFNSLNWRKRTIFEGFENIRFTSHNRYEGVGHSCEGGYVTEVSPMGRLICYATIVQEPKRRYDLDGSPYQASYEWIYGLIDGSLIDDPRRKRENCRWKD